MRPEAVKQLAHECGFELAGVAEAVPAADAERFLRWVSDGMAGAMGYLTDHRASLRTDPRLLLPTARSILCVGKLYNRAEPPREGNGSTGCISRYAVGQDYHDVMRRQLEALVERLRAQEGGFDYKICLDTAPLLERSYAKLAGLGWIGKNTCLINQDQGSWFFLGELLLSLELEPDRPVADRCGTCTRCVDACPTDAIVPDLDGGYRVESRACISYFTIELRGEIPEQHRPSLGSHIFGCDICQDVCPWNRKAPVTGEAAFLSGELQPDLGLLANLTEEEFRAKFRHTPIWRAKYSGFLRNVVLAMGNSGDQRYYAALERLAETPDVNVASHARWALARLANLADTPISQATLA